MWQFNDLRPRRGSVADVYFILVFRSLCTSGVYCTCTARLMNWPASTASRVKSMMTSAKVARSPPSVVQAGRGRFSHGYKKTDGWQQPPGLVIVSASKRRTLLTRLQDGHNPRSTSTHSVWKRLGAPARLSASFRRRTDRKYNISTALYIFSFSK